MIKTAYLRVYIPEHMATMSVAKLPAAGPDRLVTRSGPFGLREESMRNDALVIEHDGEIYICPRRPKLRLLEGVLAFRNAFGEVGGSAIVPESVAQRAAAELNRLRDAEPEQRSHILTAAWYVPLRWFAAFDPSERSYDTDPPSVVFRTPVFRALRRLRSALHVLRAVDMDESVVDELAELVDWLAAFPRHALVELDYGTVATNFDPWDLADENTVEHVRQSLDALRLGDWERAGLGYQHAVEPWAQWMFLSNAN